MATYDQYGRTDNYSVPGVPLPYLAPTAAPVQTTKNARGYVPPAWNSLTEPWPGGYDQTVYKTPVPVRLPPSTLPPAQYGNTSAYVPDPSVVARSYDPNGGYSDPLTAIASATGAMPPLLRPRPSTAPQAVIAGGVPDAQMQEAIRLGQTYQPSPAVQAALDAPPPPGSPGAAPDSRGGFLSLLFGGTRPSISGLLSSLKPPATSPAQLAAMKQASTKAQDPALAKALAAGKKSYTPTNAKARGVLAQGAVMPTVAMNGNPIRNR